MNRKSHDLRILVQKMRYDYASRISTTQFKLGLKFLTPFFKYELTVYATIMREPALILSPAYLGRILSRSSKVVLEKSNVFSVASKKM